MVNKSIEALFGHEIAALDYKTRDRLIESAFSHWRARGFPYPRMNAELIDSELRNLMKLNKTDLQHTLAHPSTVGLRLANAFHPQIWTAKVRGQSPLECFNDDRVLRHSLQRAIIMWRNRRCWSEPCVRMLMSLHNRSRVSNFRPTVARCLVDNYCRRNGQVLDFCAGFGGRLLGALTLRVKYVGVDSSIEQVCGLKQMSVHLKPKVLGSASIFHAPAERFMKDLPGRSFDLIFTSPPYFNLEKYNEDFMQSRLQFPHYKLWREHFLETVLKESYRILKTGGRLAINVADLRRYSIARDTATIGKSLFGRVECVLEICMSSNPADKLRRKLLLRREPIYIFKKK